MSWIHKPYSQWEGFEDSVDAVYRDASTWLKYEMDNNRGQIERVTKHVPTDLDKVTKAELRDFTGGYDAEKNGVCERCFVIRAANGECAGCGE